MPPPSPHTRRRRSDPIPPLSLPKKAEYWRSLRVGFVPRRHKDGTKAASNRKCVRRYCRLYSCLLSSIPTLLIPTCCRKKSKLASVTKNILFWHFVYRHLVVWQTCLTVCNCVVGTDILSSTLRRTGKTCGLGLGWVLFLCDSVSSLHSINPAPPSNSLHRAHTPSNLLRSLFLSTPSSTSTL